MGHVQKRSYVRSLFCQGREIAVLHWSAPLKPAVYACAVDAACTLTDTLPCKHSGLGPIRIMQTIWPED